MLTARGRVLLVAGLLLYFLAHETAIAELYALSLAAVVFPLIAVAFVRWGRHSLSFERTIHPRRLFAGAPFRVDVKVRNLARIASPPLVLDEPAPREVGGPTRTAVGSLLAHGEDDVSIERHTSQRGRFTIGPLRVKVIDPFGLAEIAREVAGEVPVVVYPRVESLHERTPPDPRGGAGRTLASRISNTADEFYAVRGWQEGDDLRRIHWRSTARRNELMIRQDEIRPMPRATLLVDARKTAHRDRASFDWSVSAAASIVWELARQGFAMRLATPDAGPTGARWGREATDALLAQLAVVQLSLQRSFVPAIRRTASRAGSGGALFAILPPPAPDAIGPLSHLGRAYGWCGAVLLDTPSFGSSSARERGEFDQRLAGSQRALTNAGWSVQIAGASDRFGTIWQNILGSAASRRSSPSLRS